MKIRNPYTGMFDYDLKVDDTASIKNKVVTLRHNQTAWQNHSIAHRVKVLQDWKKCLAKYQKEITKNLAEDTGRNYISKYEVLGVIGIIDGWCNKAPLLLQEKEERTSVVDACVKIREKGIPYQLVGVIGPWNFPITLALIDAIPALMAGCSVLLKSSEVTPRFLDPLEKSITEVPELAGVLQLVRGGEEAGKAVVNFSEAICFTGSVTTGKYIARSCAERLIPVFLELGGKDPAIVMADADLRITTDAVLRSAIGATGQACQSLERIYVHKSIYDDFIEMIVAKAKKVTLNSVDKSKGQIGPVIFEPQAKLITKQIEDAVKKGAFIHCGGKVENHGGLWFPPTVLSNVNHDMEIMTEETFGPIIPIMAFNDEDEAIRLANDSEFGLSASLFTSKEETIERLAYQLEAGAISVNDGSLTNKIYDAEKNAFKKSGLNGSRMGDSGLLRFFRKRALLIQTGKPSPISDFEEVKLD